MKHTESRESDHTLCHVAVTNHVHKSDKRLPIELLSSLLSLRSLTMLRTAAKATFLATALPLYVLYRLVRDLTYGTSHPAWGYRTSVLCACGQFCSSFLTSPKTPIEKPLNMPPPNFPAKILKASRIAHFFVGKGTVVTPRIAPAVKRELLKGTALVGGEHVQPVAVPVFWVIKSGQAETTDNAEEGEKVILYLAGGGTHVSPVFHPSTTCFSSLP
jgi:hypothetical protein